MATITPLRSSDPARVPRGPVDQARAIEAGRELAVDTVRQLIGLAGAAGRAGRPARVHLVIDTGDGRGCPAESWPLLVAVASRLTRAGRIEVSGICATRTGAAAAGEGAGADAQAVRFSRFVAQARVLGLEPRTCVLREPDRAAA